MNNAVILNSSLISPLIPNRNRDCNKGDFGKLICVTSSSQMSGASILTASAALRCGVGLCAVASVESALFPLKAALPEAMTLPLKQNETGAISLENIDKIQNFIKGCSAVLIGCGLSVCKDTEKIVNTLIINSEKPLIIDADGINIISKNIDILKNSNSPIILTPHVKEMSRLCKKSVEEIKSNKEEVALSFAKEYGVTVILKDFETVIATNGGKLFKNLGGHPCMAKGGSGDMLAGMVASFCAQGLAPDISSQIAVYIHSKAGELCGREMGDYSVLTSDMIKALPRVFCSLK